MLNSRIELQHGQPILYVNEQPISAMAYTTYFEERSCYRDFLDAGYRIFFVNASFTTSPINSKVTGFTPFDVGVFEDPDHPDYSEFEANVYKILRACPEAILFPRIYVSMPKWWADAHPDDTLQTARGGRRECLWSQAFLRDGSELLRAFISHVKASDYADRVAGWQICGGMTQEWFHHDLFGSLCPAAAAPFAAFCREMGWEETPLPSEKDFLCRENGIQSNLSAQRYARFANESSARAIRHFARVIKEEICHTQIVGSFYGYTLEVTTPMWGTHAMATLLDCDAIDFISAPNSYDQFRPFGIDWGDMIACDSVKLHKKLCFIESDVRTYLTKSIQESRPGRYPDDIYATKEDGKPSVWVGPPTPQLSNMAIQKSFAHQLTRGAGIWWFDMFGGWYHDPLLMESIAQMKVIYDAQPQKEGVSLPSEVVYFSDGHAFANFCPGAPELREFSATRRAMGNTGAPYSIFLVEDAAQALSHCKAAVFPAILPSLAGEAAMALCRELGIPYLCASQAHPTMSVAQLRTFFLECGVHLYTKEEDVVYVGNGYLALHSKTGGQKQLSLPFSCTAVPIFGTTAAAQTGNSVRFDLEPNATALFEVR